MASSSAEITIDVRSFVGCLCPSQSCIVIHVHSDSVTQGELDLSQIKSEVDEAKEELSSSASATATCQDSTLGASCTNHTVCCIGVMSKVIYHSPVFHHTPSVVLFLGTSSNPYIFRFLQAKSRSPSEAMRD